MLGVARKDERFAEVLGQKRTSDAKHQQPRSLDIAFDQPARLSRSVFANGSSGALPWDAGEADAALDAGIACRADDGLARISPASVCKTASSSDNPDPISATKP